MAARRELGRRSSDGGAQGARTAELERRRGGLRARRSGGGGATACARGGGEAGATAVANREQTDAQRRNRTRG
jgi:hypothetical protein